MDNLKTWLDGKGWSQQQLADELGVTQGAVSHWLVGRSKPSAETLLDLTEVTGLTLDQLLDRE